MLKLHKHLPLVPKRSLMLPFHSIIQTQSRPVPNAADC